MERRLLSPRTQWSRSAAPSSRTWKRRGIAEALLVPNGWDADAIAPPASGDNFPEPAAPVAELLDPERVSRVYTGRFGSYGRDPRPLLEGLRSLAAGRPGAAAGWSIMAGTVTEEEKALFSGASTRCG